MQLGDFTIRWFSDGVYKLDGGAMFGVVPKVVWTRKYPVDENNFIPLALNAVLIETPEAKVLIDTGYGTKLTPKQVSMFHLVQPPTLLESLAAGGVRPEEIDYVVYSHMHHDHASGATYRDADGQLKASFPRAKHVMQRLEWEEAKHPNIRSAHAYWEENWSVLESAGQIMPVDGEVELVPGVTLIPTGGHTRGHQAVLVTSQGETALHLGDLLPTRAHLNPLWVMAYDDYPMDSIAAKEKWIGRAKAEGWWLTLYHDPEVHAGVWDAEGQLVKSIRAEAALTPER